MLLHVAQEKEKTNTEISNISQTQMRKPSILQLLYTYFALFIHFIYVHLYLWYDHYHQIITNYQINTDIAFVRNNQFSSAFAMAEIIT